jgi:anti-sigma regulatory factor (Ser/Thr protein kinase)
MALTSLGEAPRTQRLGHSETGQQLLLNGMELRIQRTSRPGIDMPEEDRAWPGRIRRIARAYLRNWDLALYTDRVELLLTELVTNALRHGRCEEIGVRLFCTSSQLCAEVSDGSPGSPFRREVGPDDEYGRGIVLVEAYADDWGVKDDGTVTWCALNLTCQEVS